jgi:hypothetical protein
MSIHLVYPVDFSKKSAPWSIGNNLYKALKKIDTVKVYQWTSYEKIVPKKGDILIGHAHPNPFTVFRRSLDNSNWRKKILIQPFNSDPLQMSYLYSFINDCDLFFAITGKFWFDNLKKTIFKSWKKKMLRLDMAINLLDYQNIKKKFNKKFQRKFIYIGNEIKFNNYTKNTAYLKDIANTYKPSLFSTAGNKKIDRIKHYGWLNFHEKKGKEIIKKHDFLIMASKHDANPTVILEAMAWGIIPLVTKECGYYKNKGIYNMPLNNLKETINIIKKLQAIKDQDLKKVQRYNYLEVKNKYTWKIFTNKVMKFVKNKKNFKNPKINKEEENIFFNYYKKSPNYHLRFVNIVEFFLISLKFFCKKIIR